ncbi:MAG: MFS transporter [Candidatus Methylacidiphilales bacterium]
MDLPPSTPPSPAASPSSASPFSKELTFKLECRRAIAMGILETAGNTFLQLIAVRHFQADALAKGFVATGGSGGMLLAPVAVWLAGRMRWTASYTAAYLLAFAGACFTVCALSPWLYVFVVLCVMGMVAAASAVPFFTQIVQDNYPERERGKLFSATSMIRIATSALFAMAAGAALSGRMNWFPLLLLVYAVAFYLSAWYVWKCPSRIIGDDMERLHSPEHAQAAAKARWVSDTSDRREAGTDDKLLLADEILHQGGTGAGVNEAAEAAGAVAMAPDASGQQGFWSAWNVVVDDPVFRLTLISWMFMGISNLMMLSLRVEYLANERYGLHLSEMYIALLTVVLPSVARFMLSSVWGRLFDTMNFFGMRIILNACFALSILTFFTGTTTMGLITGSLIFGVATAGGDVTWSLWVTKFAPPHRTADYMAVHTSLTGMRGLMAPLIAFSLLPHYTVQTLAIVAGILIGVASALLVPELLAERRARMQGGGRTSLTS